MTYKQAILHLRHDNYDLQIGLGAALAALHDCMLLIDNAGEDGPDSAFREFSLLQRRRQGKAAGILARVTGRPADDFLGEPP